LSIPTVRDRVAQSALKTVIEPIFEADMLECSYGFRPRRSSRSPASVRRITTARPCTPPQPPSMWSSA
jgi:retron-type reverse transcriptase